MQARQGWRKKDSRSYLTDDQRRWRSILLNKFSKKIVFTMNGVNRGALIIKTTTNGQLWLCKDRDHHWIFAVASQNDCHPIYQVVRH